MNKLLISNWREFTLGEIANFQNGHAFYNDGYSEKGYFVIDLFNISEEGKLRFSSRDKYVSASIANKYRKFILNKDDLIIAMTDMTQSMGILGKCAIIDKNDYYVLNQRIGRIVPNKQVLTKFLYYYINSPCFLKPLINLAKGAVQKYVNTDDIKKNKVNLPLLPTQRKIAAILSAYDDLIENNNRRIKILEEMARLIYKEWFVNFRFPGHENVKFVDSPLGRIPEGWEVINLGQYIYLDKGISYKGEYLTDDGVPMVNLKCINIGGGFKKEGVKAYSGVYKEKHTIKLGDIVIANTDLTQAGNVIGSPAIVSNIYNYEDIIFSHHLYAVRFRNELFISREYLYQLLSAVDFKGFAKGQAIGTTVLGLRGEGILEYKFIYPTITVLQRFENDASSIRQLTEVLYKENEILRQTRELLLPKLISGEIDVSEMDIEIAEDVS